VIDKSVQTGDVIGSVVSSGFVGGSISNSSVNNITTGEQKQNLAQAAAQIQELLVQLEKSYPTNTTAGKMAIATETIEYIESNPKLMDKVLSALKAGSTQALAQALDHPAATFVIAAFEDWQKNK
jgi:phosphoenolpyruvate-protein kinase (PTS system EI component)